MKTHLHLFYIAMLAGVLTGSVRQINSTKREVLSLLDITKRQQEIILTALRFINNPEDTTQLQILLDENTKLHKTWYEHSKKYN